MHCQPYIRLIVVPHLPCEILRVIFRKCQFVHKIYVHDFGAPLSPPPNQQSDGWRLEFVLQGPQSCKHSQKIMNELSQNGEQTESRTNGSFLVSLPSAFVKSVSFHQGATKGGRQTELDHILSFLATFWSLFLTLLSLFFHHYLPDSFCPSLRVRLCHS